jgi:hypothetical protein
MLIYTLDERLSKSDDVTRGIRENKDSTKVKQPSINNHTLGKFNSNIG